MSILNMIHEHAMSILNYTNQTADTLRDAVDYIDREATTDEEGTSSRVEIQSTQWHGRTVDQGHDPSSTFSGYRGAGAYCKVNLLDL